MDETARIDCGAVIGANAVIGPCVYIGENAEVGTSCWDTAARFAVSESSTYLHQYV